jgi:hypothetical protein
VNTNIYVPNVNVPLLRQQYTALLNRIYIPQTAVFADEEDLLQGLLDLVAEMVFIGEGKPDDFTLNPEEEIES